MPPKKKVVADEAAETGGDGVSTSRSHQHSAKGLKYI
jgi:hypothetical protein